MREDDVTDWLVTTRAPWEATPQSWMTTPSREDAEREFKRLRRRARQGLEGDLAEVRLVRLRMVACDRRQRRWERGVEVARWHA